MQDRVLRSVLDDAAIAPVISLARVDRALGVPERARRGAEQAERFLERRYGPRWVEIPADLGRPALQAEQLLARGPSRVDPESVHPGDATTVGRAVVGAGATIAELIDEESDVLAAALGADLGGLTLRELEAVARAVLALGSAPAAEASWSEPAAAEAAEVVLRVHGSRLLESTELHERVYRWFTERVWDVPERWLRAGRRPWRIVTRARLRTALAEVGREERFRMALGPTAELLLRARQVRDELAVAAPLLTTHLGVHDRGPLSDVREAAAALGAVRDLQEALGPSLDPDRLGALLRADAFSSRDVTGPASTILAGLAAWRADLAQLGARHDGEMTAADLSLWCEQADVVLPAVGQGMEAVDDLGVHPTTLRELVNDLLARQRVAELAGSRREPPGSEGTEDSLACAAAPAEPAHPDPVTPSGAVS